MTLNTIMWIASILLSIGISTVAILYYDVSLFSIGIFYAVLTLVIGCKESKNGYSKEHRKYDYQK
jgi:hypothetical protein